jgi:hypothetical protein
MKIFGFYPFNVNVANMFAPDLNVNLNVSCFQHRTYFKKQQDESLSIMTEMTSPDGKSSLTNLGPILLHGGASLAFPMQFADENVVITLENSSQIDYGYSISVGGKALCRAYLYQNATTKTLLESVDNVKFTASSFETSDIFKDELSKLNSKDGGGFHVGGTWDIPASFPYGWTLEIRKHTFDPETVSVPIGPTTPG